MQGSGAKLANGIHGPDRTHGKEIRYLERVCHDQISGKQMSNWWQSAADTLQECRMK